MAYILSRDSTESLDTVSKSLSSVNSSTSKIWGSSLTGFGSADLGFSMNFYKHAENLLKRRNQFNRIAEYNCIFALLLSPIVYLFGKFSFFSLYTRKQLSILITLKV